MYSTSNLMPVQVSPAVLPGCRVLATVHADARITGWSYTETVRACPLPGPIAFTPTHRLALLSIQPQERRYVYQVMPVPPSIPRVSVLCCVTHPLQGPLVVVSVGRWGKVVLPSSMACCMAGRAS